MYTIFCRLIPPVDMSRRPAAPSEIYFHTPVCSQVMTKLDRDMPDDKINKVNQPDRHYKFNPLAFIFLMILFEIRRYCHGLRVRFQKKSAR